MKTWDHLYENWINGNRKDCREILKKCSKKKLAEISRDAYVASADGYTPAVKILTEMLTFSFRE